MALSNALDTTLQPIQQEFPDLQTDIETLKAENTKLRNECNERKSAEPQQQGEGARHAVPPDSSSLETQQKLQIISKA